MPTRDRAELLARALDSVINATASVAEHVEVVVSDGSADEASVRVVEHRLSGWPGGYRYVSNRTALSLPGNINRAMELATGEWILQLHDDDYLLPDAGPVILETTRRAPPDERVLLFGVEIVDEHGVVQRRQRFRRERHLVPEKALRRVLRNSSLVRQPAAVVHRAAFQDEGWYDTTLGGPCDTDMWCAFSPATACAASPPPRACTRFTTRRPRAGCGIPAPSGSTARSSIAPSPAALSPSGSSGAGRPTSSISFILAGVYRRLRLRQRDPVIAPYGVPPARFRRQLDSLRRAGYQFIHPDELLAYLNGQAGLPRRPLLLTFDDCYADLLSTALPELVERGIPPVAFAVSGCIGGSNRWDQAAGAATLPLLDIPGLEMLERSGLEIGAHSRSHRSLTGSTPGSWPAGRPAGPPTSRGPGCGPRACSPTPTGDHSPEVRQAVRQAGYAAAFTVSPGRIFLSSDRYALPRVDIRRHHTGLRFRLRVALLSGGRLRRPARELLGRLSRHGAALVPLAATLTSVADGSGGLLRLAA
jgi:hypothetical protein